MRMPFVGSKRPDTADVKITGTFVEYTPDNVKDVLAVADKTGEGAKITIQPRFSIKAGDYIKSLVWVGNHGSDGIVLVELKNALCTTGLNTQTTDKDVGTLPFEFVGHADDVSSTELPIKILLIGMGNQTKLVYRAPRDFAGADRLQERGQQIIAKMTAMYADMVESVK